MRGSDTTATPALRGDLRGIALAVGAALATLVWLLASSVAWYDAGELAASAATLGVPHPTGFPLFHLGSHPHLLWPLAPLALRMHLAGALAATAACGLWWWTLTAGAERRLFPWLGALLVPLLATSVAMHVRAAEIYAWVWLHTAVLLAAGVLLRGARRVVAVWLLGGVGALIHAESAGLAAVAAVWVTAQAPPRGRLAPAAIGAGLATLAGAGIAYLPLAASRLPGLSWGDVRTVDALVAHLSAASIRHAFAHRMGAGVAAASRMLAEQLWRDLGPALVLAALPGCALLWRRARAALLWSGALIALDAAYAVMLNPMGLRDGQVGLIASLGVALLGWTGIVGITDRVALLLPARSPIQRAAAAVVLVLLIAMQLGRLLTVAPNADLRAATHLADALLADAPPGSLLLASGDQRASSCIWQQVGVGSRPDCRCVPLVFLRDPRMTAYLAETGAGAYFLTAAAQLRTATTPRARAGALGAWLRPAAADGPVLWERGHGFEDAQVGDHLRAGYPWDRLTPTQAQPSSPQDLDAALQAALRACQRAGEGHCRPGPAATAIGGWASVWGAWLLRTHKPGAARYLETAATLAPTAAPVLNNLAVLRMGQGAAGEALQLCQRALAAQPDYRRAHRTAARAALRAGDAAASLWHARRWLRGAQPRAAERWLAGLIGEAKRRHLPALAAQLAAERRPHK